MGCPSLYASKSASNFTFLEDLFDVTNFVTNLPNVSAMKSFPASFQDVIEHSPQ